MTEMMIVMELVECHRENYTHNFPQIHRSGNEFDAPHKISIFVAVNGIQLQKLKQRPNQACRILQKLPRKWTPLPLIKIVPNRIHDVRLLQLAE